MADDAKREKGREKKLRAREDVRPEYVVAGAVLELSDVLVHGLRAGIGTPILAQSAPTPVPVPVPIQIPIQCGGQWDAFAFGTGIETERDGPGGDDADAVSQAAYDIALQEAKDNAKASLDALFAQVVCEEGCTKTKVPEEPTYQIVSQDVEAKYGAFFAWVAYTWTIRVKAKQTFKCV
jgi:hypothetical protein